MRVTKKCEGKRYVSARGGCYSYVAWLYFFSTRVGHYFVLCPFFLLSFCPANIQTKSFDSSRPVPCLAIIFLLVTFYFGGTFFRWTFLTRTRSITKGVLKG